MEQEDEMQKLEITDNKFLRQFEATIKSELVTIEYVEQERKIFLTRLKMDETLKKEGYLEKFIETVLEEISQTNARIMPTSPEIAKFFKKHKRFKHLLPIGINI